MTPDQEFHLNFKKLPQAFLDNPKKKKTSRRINSNNDDSLHGAIYPLLFIAQIFGLMPISGIKSSSTTALEFKWKSFRTFYTLFLVSFQIGLIFLEILRVHNNSFNAKSVGK